MASLKNPWGNNELKTFLSLVAEDRIQNELDGATRNERVFKELSETLAKYGFQRSSKQCREKLKKLRCEYRSVKDQNGWSGTDRGIWKWFTEMEAIYGDKPEKPVSNGKESGVETAALASSSAVSDNESVAPTTSFGQMLEVKQEQETPAFDNPSRCSTPSSNHSAPSGSKRRNGSGKRKRSTADLGMVLEHMREEVERFTAVSEGNVGRLVEEMRLARETETELRRQELAQEKDFNDAFLAVFRNLVQAVANKDS